MVDIIKAASVPFGMLIVGVLVYSALKAGVDGAVLMSGLTIIGGLGGFYVNKLYRRK